jgi:hypothetical protein
MYQISINPSVVVLVYSSYVPLADNLGESTKILSVGNFTYLGKSIVYNEKFVDLSIPLIFLFALIDPIIFIINHIILKKYNKNCRDLYIANKLFYVEDPINDRKYNF